MVAELHALGVYYPTLRPDNVVLVRGENPDEFELRLTDFGSATADYAEITQVTPIYAPPNLRDRLPIASKAERERIELYAIGRTLLHVMLISVCAFEKSDADALFSLRNEQGVSQQFSKLSSYYSPEISTVMSLLHSEADLNLIQQHVD